MPPQKKFVRIIIKLPEKCVKAFTIICSYRSCAQSIFDTMPGLNNLITLWHLMSFILRLFYSLLLKRTPLNERILVSWLGRHAQTWCTNQLFKTNSAWCESHIPYLTIPYLDSIGYMYFPDIMWLLCFPNTHFSWNFLTVVYKPCL